MSTAIMNSSMNSLSHTLHFARSALARAAARAVHAARAPAARTPLAASLSNQQRALHLMSSTPSSWVLLSGRHPYHHHQHQYQQQQRRSLFIQTESTPAEDSLKFKPGCPVLGTEARSTVEITSVRDANAMGSPLAATLLRIEGVESIMFGSDFVTVSKNQDTAWQLIKPDVFGALSDFFGESAAATTTTTASDAAPTKQVVNPELAMQPPQDTEIRPEDSEVVAMIKELLDTRIRPTIQDDGGDIEYMGFEEESGTVKLKLKGACRTCDSSVVTLKNGIENMLQYFIPEVKKVEQVLDEAERIANEEFAKLEQVIGMNNSNEGQVLLKK